MKNSKEDFHAGGELRADSATHGTETSSEARGLSQTMRAPARRKRSASQKVNRIRPNGHGGASSSLTESPDGTKTNGKLDGSSMPAALAGLPERESAASDDATGTTPAGDAAQSSAAACAGRDACAEVAAPRSRSSSVRGDESGTDDDRRPRAPDDAKTDDVKTNNKTNGAAPEGVAALEAIPTGKDDPLAFDAPGFVEEMHTRVNLYAIGKALLEAPDMKIKQRAWEYLLEMKYGRGAPASAEEVPRIDVELLRPQQ